MDISSDGSNIATFVTFNTKYWRQPLFYSGLECDTCFLVHHLQACLFSTSSPRPSRTSGTRWTTPRRTSIVPPWRIWPRSWPCSWPNIWAYEGHFWNSSEVTWICTSAARRLLEGSRLSWSNEDWSEKVTLSTGHQLKIYTLMSKVKYNCCCLNVIKNNFDFFFFFSTSP